MKRMLAPLVLLTIAWPAPAARSAENVEIEADVVYGHKDGLAMTFDVLKPKQRANRAGVLFMVSGGFYSVWYPPENNATLFKSLLDKGFTMFIVRHGSSPKYLVPDIVEDVRRAVRYIRKNAARFGVDPERLGVTGASAGGHLSLMLGTTGDDGDPKAKDELLRAGDRVAAVVAYFPPTDVRPWILPTSSYYKTYPALRFDAAKAEACSPVLAVSPDDAPALLVHGDADQLVPLDHSRNILAELQKNRVDCELLVIERAGHGFSGKNKDRAAAARDAWFEKHLLKKDREPAATK
ncbi:MAG: alpha/beta hydrolase [Pirellulales bacterium]|nr:alpha/beta hydrolase [Pirellulales bacterium]